jgi:putative ABC transport system permease protein
MTRWRILWARVAEFVRSGPVDRDLRDELDAHLDLATDDYIRRGIPASEARRLARRDFGGESGLEHTREAMRDRRGLRGLDTVLQDVRYAGRLLRKTPGFTIAAVATLALGLGANVAIFSLVNGVLLRPLPYPQPDRLVTIWESVSNPKDGPTRIAVAPANFVDYVARTRSFAAMAGVARLGRNLAGVGTPERLIGDEVTEGYFATLGVAPFLGRSFVADDYAEGANQVVILFQDLWQRRFGGDPALVGRSITLDDRPYRVVGIMPKGVTGLTFQDEMDPPGLVTPAVFPADILSNRQDHEIRVAARLRPGVPVDAARDEMASLSAAMAAEFPGAKNTTTGLEALGADQAREVRPLLVALVAAVGLVLLVAAVNVASLLVVRSNARRREIAVRFAMGATRARVMRELMTQSVVLAILGLGAGLVFGIWAKDLLVALAPPSLPHLDAIRLDGRVLVATSAAAALTCLVFGSLPAWQVSRTRPVDALRASERTVSASWVRRSRSLLVTAEVALSMLLLVGAGLMVRSLIELNRRDLGFDPAPVVAATVGLPPARYRTPDARLAFFEALATRVASLPGVEKVAFASRFPLRGGWTSGFLLEPVSGPIEEAFQQAGFQAVSPGYFATLGIPLRAGRLLEAGDREGNLPVAVVSEEFSRAILGGANPIGRTFSRGPSAPIITIVGVVGDIRRGGRATPVDAQVYLPAAQTSLYPARLSEIAVRTNRDAGALASAIPAEVWAIDGGQPVTNVRSLAETLELGLAERYFQTFLFLLFAGLALALALVGVYGVMAYIVSQRAREIGLRMALGADHGRILRWVVGQMAWLVTAGTLSGLGAGLLLSRSITQLLFGVTPSDPASYVAAAAMLVASALAASYLAARRAIRIDPVSALR